MQASIDASLYPRYTRTVDRNYKKPIPTMYTTTVLKTLNAVRRINVPQLYAIPTYSKVHTVVQNTE